MIAFLPIILKKAAREHGQKLCTWSRRFWIMYAPIERPMINDVDPLVTFEKFRPFFLSLFFFFSMVTLLVIYSTFYFISFLLIYYSRSRTFLGEVLTISSDLLARTLMFHFFFFFFLQVVTVDYLFLARQFCRGKPWARVVWFDYAQLRTC